MKKFTRVLVAVMAAVMVLLTVSVTAFAAKTEIEDMQNSVVFISATVPYTSPNYDLTFYNSWSGTGFAVGTPGKPVQYVATNYHVVTEPSGIYTLYMTEAGELIDFVQEPEGTAYPSSNSGTIDGVEVYALTDYWKVDTNNTELYAYFSAATNDYVSLSIVDFSSDVDLALCKLACDPTDKIEAFPLQLKGDCKKGDRIISFGYPGISNLSNAEMRLDPSDCTIEDGIISKIQRTNGPFNADKTFEALLVTADITHGMSGGPVFNEETGAIVGVNSFGNMNANLEVADYAICIDYLLDMLDKEHIPYEVYGSKSGIPMMYIIIGGAVLFVILLIVIILLATKKKTPAVVPATPVFTPSAPAAPVAPVAPAAPENKYYLCGISGPLAGRKFAIDSSATIGRDGARCNVTFPVEQPGVSSVHCEIKVSGGSLYLTDLGSSYGTFLGNGMKLDANTPVILTSGSKFWVGAKENLFEVKY